LRPFERHWVLNFQESHSPLKTTPIPQSVDASTQKLIGLGGGGLRRWEPTKLAERQLCHHEMSVRTLGLGDLRTNGDEAVLKEAAKRDRAGNRDRLSGMASEQWTSVPRRDCASRWVNLWSGSNWQGLRPKGRASVDNGTTSHLVSELSSRRDPM
jgi:hypothetical protein